MSLFIRLLAPIALRLAQAALLAGLTRAGQALAERAQTMQPPSPPARRQGQVPPPDMPDGGA